MVSGDLAQALGYKHGSAELKWIGPCADLLNTCSYFLKTAQSCFSRLQRKLNT